MIPIMNFEQLLPRLLLLAGCLNVATLLSAQTPTLFVENAVAFPDEEVQVNVRITDAEIVAGVQMSLNWNTEQLEFQGVTNIALDGSFDANFNRTKLDSGMLAYIVADPTAQPLGLADSSILFTLRFLAVPNSGLTAPIAFTDNPRPTRVSNQMAQSVDFNSEDGQVDLGSVGLLDVVSEHPRFRASPNPFSERVRLDLRSNYASQATLEVLSVAGRVVLRRSLRVATSDNTIYLSAADFPSAGSYIVRVTTDREQLHRKVVLGRGGR